MAKILYKCIEQPKLMGIEELNKLGNDGWELVVILKGEKLVEKLSYDEGENPCGFVTIYHYYFKKQ